MSSSSRRPVSHRTRGVVLSSGVRGTGRSGRLGRIGRLGAAVGLLVLVAGCSAGPVEIASPNGLPSADEQACEAFVAGLPDTLAGEDKREITPTDALGAAYGDPAITVTCGVPVPADFSETSSCEVEGGVGWFVPPEVFDDQNADVTMTAAGYRPVVQLKIPHDYRPDGPAAAIAELGADVDDHMELQQNCQ